MRTILSIALAALAMAVSSPSTTVLAADAVSVGDLSIIQPWARASAGQANAGAAFMTIANKGDQDDKLVSAAAAVARKVEVHETTVDGGVVKMRMLMGGLTIAAGGSVELKPMGLHVMMMGLTEKLVEGDTLTLTLTFEKAGSVELAVPITGPGAMMAPGMH